MSFAKNKKAYHDYQIIEEFEAGINLLGAEVKSIRAGRVQMKGSYVALLSDEAPYLVGLHISPYAYSHDRNLDPVRRRKLLLNKKEIVKLQRIEKETGTAIIPLEIYPKRGLIKVKIAIARGKKLFDKRQSLKSKAEKRKIDQTLKRFN